MIVGFFHDHEFVQVHEVVYTTGSLNSNIWLRYLDSGADKLLVCGRRRRLDNIDVKSFPVASHPSVDFSLIRGFSSAKALVAPNRSDVDELVQLISCCDRVIARLPSEIGYRAVDTAVKLGIPVAVEVVGCPYDALRNYGSLKARLYSILAMYRMKKCVGKAHAAIYVTKQFLQSRYPSTASLVQNASNVEIMEVADKSLEPRLERFDDIGHILQLTFVGDLSNNIKGLDVLISSLKIFEKSSSRQLVVNVMGKGDVERYKALISDLGLSTRFIFHGFISSKRELLDVLDETDVFIHPSYQEGLPRAVIEAMSRGCPILSSSAGGLSELVLRENIHAPGDHSKLASDLLSVCSNRDLIRESVSHSLNESKQYLKATLDVKRSSFWKSFLARS
ncbi:glycosyltransferase [Thalassolituus maritimus]|uniref:Glycosyl transferase family 1 domain-containing protein n=1 Tax=Thalassolituus maritimus TaxID=484498 RepID=A0ABP9ZZW9_9GAMM